MYRRTFVGADVMHRQDVRVIQLPGGAGFAFEPRHGDRVACGLGDQLDRNVATQARSRAR